MAFFRRDSLNEAAERIAAVAAVAQDRVERIRFEAQRNATQTASIVQNQTQLLAATVGELRTSVQERAEEFRAAAHSGELRTSVQARAEGVCAAAQSGAAHASEAASQIAQTSADHVANAAGHLRGKWNAQQSLFKVSPKRASREKSGQPWGDAEHGTRTLPPIVLRMVSSDQLSPCSMEIEWENGTGERQSWSSHRHPLCSFLAAEKILPANVTDVSVQFKVQAVVKSFDVGKVDRQADCNHVEDSSGNIIPEVFWFWRSGSDSINDKIAIDMTFELTGKPNACHVSRVWNAARGSLEMSEYEYWPDEESRPLPNPCLKVLAAADDASLPGLGIGDPLLHCSCATKRLVAASKALQDVRRETLDELRSIDRHLTGQWVAVNSANTAGAGLAVASAAAFFVSPVVGIGLGVASAATSGAATAGDILADQAVLTEVRECLNDDDMNMFAVATLQHEWLLARDHAGAALKAGNQSENALTMEELGLYGTYVGRVGLAVASTIVNAADTVSSAFTVAAESAAAGSRIMPVASKALGVAGAVISTGLAVHGWVTTKSLQALTRQRLTEISQAMLGTQRWLAAMSELQCAICLTGIGLNEEAQCCKDSWHYSHRHCLELWERECRTSGRDPTCPLCCGPLSSRRGRLEDLILEDMRMLVPDSNN